MSADGERHILATSGGFRPSGRNPFEWRPGPLIELALRLTGRDRPRVCYLGTAAGDSVNSTSAYYGAMALTSAQPSHLALFAMPTVEDPRRHLLDQDLIWVGGGSVANLLAVWRVHGLDSVLREAWEAGIVLGGVSAGSICWHIGGTTDSFGPDLRPVTNGLALLPYSNGVHYDSEEQRRPMFRALIADGTLPTGYATDDGVGLHYVGTQMVAAVTDRAGAAAYRVERGRDGSTVETRLEPRLLV